MESMMISCPPASQLESRFEALVGNPDRHPDLVAHVQDCSVCQARLEGLLDADERTAQRPGQGVPLPAVAGYEVIARLGRGGMGVVYKARHRKLNRLVALKMIRAEIASPDHRRRIQIEAEAVARLQHPSIVQIHEVGEHDSLPFLALELVEGGSLARRLGKEPLSAVEAARMLRLLARAVAHAHGRGIVHRDLKPENVLLGAPLDEPALQTALGCPKITDFGLARLAGEGPRLTRPGALVGTPGYMAPEQVEGQEAGAPADVYSLGVILYRLLAGCLPFESRSLGELLYQISHHPPPPLQQKVPWVPESLERLCLACLEKAADRRPTASEVAKRLDEFLDSAKGPLLPRPSRRRLLWGGLSSAALLAWGLGWGLAGLSLPSGDRPRAALSVNALRVHHFAGRDQVPHGELGKHSSAANYRDYVSVMVELSEAAYFYVVELNFEGKEQLIWPADADGEAAPAKPPTKRTQVCCPGGDRRLWLDEEKARSGLQVYVVAASRRPLPSYARWKQQRGTVNWTRHPPGNTVWLADPHGCSALHRGGVQRSKVRPAVKGPALDALCQAMRAGGVEVVKALAFPVLPKEGAR
jgi:serine/threonine protein kinase